MPQSPLFCHISRQLYSVSEQAQKPCPHESARAAAALTGLASMSADASVRTDDEYRRSLRLLMVPSRPWVNQPWSQRTGVVCGLRFTVRRGMVAHPSTLTAGLTLASFDKQVNKRASSPSVEQTFAFNEPSGFRVGGKIRSFSSLGSVVQATVSGSR